MTRKIINHIILLLIFFAAGFTCMAQEICNNGIDDDHDGLIDLRDPDCQCRFVVTDNLLKNGSFEQYDHCPVTFTYSNDYKIASYWQYGTYTNETDYYHNLQCSFDSSLIMLHMRPTLPLPDGKGFISILNSAYINPIPEKQMVKSYVGQCLQSPLKPGEQYTLSFSAGRFRSWDNYTGIIYPFTVAVFGHKDCNAVPFGKLNVSGNGCPTDYPGWVFLGKTKVTSNGTWVQSKINFTVPSEINVIEIGTDSTILPPIISFTDSTTFLDYHVYYLDDLHLLPTKDFPFEYIQVQTGTGCNGNGSPVLVAPVYANATYQWYKDSIAISGATGNLYQLPVLTVKDYYNVLISLPGKCIISEPYSAMPDPLKKLNFSTDTVLCNNSSILLAPAIDGITYRINGANTSEVIINKPGLYSFTATNIFGCQRTFNINVAEQKCSDCELFIPNAFTPNGDGLNDLLKAKPSCPISDFDFLIFDRWGDKIFESHNSDAGWDGNYLGNPLSTGVYVYLINYKIASQTTKMAKGTVTLIR